jgi:hypothetical protein
VEGTQAVEARARHPYRTAAIVATALAVVVALAGAALYVWLGSYAPLDAGGGFAPGPGLAMPTNGASGKTSFVPAGERRTFDTAFTLRNTGRFTVTVHGVADDASTGLRPLGLLGTDSATASADPGHIHHLRELRVGPGDSAILVVRWSVPCGGRTSEDALRLRYRYLSLFERTQRVTLPFAVTLRCGGPKQP